jgi:dsRNA-specific ribonuclease
MYDRFSSIVNSGVVSKLSSNLVNKTYLAYLGDKWKFDNFFIYPSELKYKLRKDLENNKLYISYLEDSFEAFSGMLFSLMELLFGFERCIDIMRSFLYHIYNQEHISLSDISDIKTRLNGLYNNLKWGSIDKYIENIPNPKGGFITNFYGFDTSNPPKKIKIATGYGIKKNDADVMAGKKVIEWILTNYQIKESTLDPYKHSINVLIKNNKWSDNDLTIFLEEFLKRDCLLHVGILGDALTQIDLIRLKTMIIEIFASNQINFYKFEYSGKIIIDFIFLLVILDKFPFIKHEGILSKITDDHKYLTNNEIFESVARDFKYRGETENEKKKNLIYFDLVEQQKIGPLIGCIHSIITENFSYGLATLACKHILDIYLESQNFYISFTKIFDPITRINDLFQRNGWGNIGGYWVEKMNQDNKIWTITLLRPDFPNNIKNKIVFLSMEGEDRDKIKSILADKGITLLIHKYHYNEKYTNPY